MRKLFALAAVAGLLLTGAASAADLQIPRGVVAEPAPSGWDGAYIGAHVGYGPGTLTDLGILGYAFSGIAGSGGGPVSFSGVFAGGQIGYNFTLNDHFVVGVEGDLSWSNESGSQTLTGPVVPPFPATSVTQTTTLNWTGDLTAHAGYDMGMVMPYVLGGVAVANNTYGFSSTSLGLGGSASGNTTQVGYTLGAGLGMLFTDHVSGFVEGRYSDYGIGNYTLSGFSGLGAPASINEPASLTDWTARTGVNFHF
jgi:outer membrane immunogenic protein